MKRRAFITLLGGAVAWPLAARAQQPERMRRVGVLSTFAESDPEAQSLVQALDRTLQELGWVEGRNLRIDRRWAAGNPGRIEGFAKLLIGLEPDVIVAHGTPAVIALRNETRSILIVFVQVTDPIGAGFIANLAHPGGNITGFTTYEPSMVGKWGEMLKEVAPQISRIAFLFNPDTAPYVIRYFQGPLETSARSLGLQPNSSPVHNTSEIESAITALAREPGGGLIMMPDTFNIVHRERIIGLWPKQIAGHLSVSVRGRRRRPDFLRARLGRSVSAGGRVCRSHPQGCEASRASSAGANEIRNDT